MATHPREAGSSAAEGDSLHSNKTRRKTSLASFQLLPMHLKTTIITMACSKPRDEVEESSRFLPPLDPQPAKAMALVSKTFYADACAVLYAHIRVTRISSLKLLLDAVISRPPLGRLIKSLHVGPDEQPISEWEPIRAHEVVLRLWLPEDRGQWPAWIPDDQLFYRIKLHQNDSAARTGPVKAIEAAIDSACSALDVRVGAPGRSARGVHLLGDTWNCRVFEVFAATELYILSMRRWETEAKNEGNRGYPRLVIINGPAGQSHTMEAGTADVLTLSRSQLLRRLAARHSQTDRFDHPLIFLRSGQPMKGWAFDSRAPRRPPSETFDEAEDRHSAIDAQLEDFALPNTATIGGVLSLARALLAQTPLLLHLSLTGFLASAVCGARAPGELSRLRSVSLGPPAVHWSWPSPLRFDVPAMKSVERLWLGGHTLTAEQAATIVGRDGVDKAAFSSLRDFRWSPARAIDGGKLAESELLDTINVLAGPEVGSAEGGHNERKRAQGWDIEDERHSSRPRLYIEVRLDERDVARVLAAAPTTAAREAWRIGGAPDVGYMQHHRLRLLEMPPYRSSWPGLRELMELYGEGRRGFEKEAERGAVCC